jgi:hypothetical protein
MPTTHVFVKTAPRFCITCLFVTLFLTGCTAINEMNSAAAQRACPVTEPAWAKPPEDSAVQGTPGYGYYFINADSSIWASAWYTGENQDTLRAGGEGIKVGWFRPAGATLEITGERVDGQAPPLEAHASCCYPTRFQASGLYFPSEGCWEVNAKAKDKELSFTVWVEP